ncbi:hypothetical protein GCM10007358_17610 [Phocicoccus schoeneichii]|uniref:RNA polymerase sigma factor RpoD n=1 Tax=Phocicoccus schoeneichii TaxID=1812261 RepID=A0A6V7RMD4_9BACL|nr:sigma-70 family RNA polymerase sigma factor [Jeotgalicoccus schoeneichii]GGH55864.1 hypothetical protein GCM10007358_17610 [Jeotgalicoccus schoeneichii]CAD2079315.1 RNA polymerase sigma factor RpoD [Jeotgalicoccus schoeneichii]
MKGKNALIEYINNNIRFGSVLDDKRLIQLYREYSLNFSEKIEVFNELNSLDIKLNSYSKHYHLNVLNTLIVCLENEKEIHKYQIEEVLEKNNVYSQYYEEIFKEIDKRNLVKIIETEYKDEFDFLEDFNDIDLDEFLSSENLTSELKKYEDIVDKSFNIDYLTSYKEGIDQESAVENLIIANRGLVKKIAKQYSGLVTTSLDKDDIEQFALEGLLEAIKRFEVAKGYQFSTYAYWWLRQATSRGIYETADMIRIPIHMRERINKLQKIEKELSVYLGRDVTNFELSNEMDISEDEIRKIKFLIFQSNIPSLDISVNEDGDTSLVEMIEDTDGELVEERVIENSLINDINNLLTNNLTKREKEVLIYRFGLEGRQEKMTLEEIGKIFSVTRERIRQIEAKALRKLRTPKLKKILEEYFYETN